MSGKNLPLLLLDNETIGTIINEGQYKFSMLSFEEAKAIIEMYEADMVVRTFSGDPLEKIVFDYLDIQGKQFSYKKVSNMRKGQDAIAFKLYITPSETQPIIDTPIGTEAKKIQNVYVCCQYISRIDDSF